MRSSELAPWPDEWRDAPDRRYRTAAVGCVVLLLLSLAVTAYYFVTDLSGFGIYALLFSVVLAGVALIGFDGHLRTRKAGAAPLRTGTRGSGRPALEIPYSPVQFSCYAVIMTGIAAFFALPAYGALTNLPESAAPAILWGALLLFFLSLPILMLLGKFTLGKVQLSEDGIYQRGWTFESYFPWESILQVQAVRMGGVTIWVVPRDETRWERRQIAPFWKQDRVPKYPMIRIPGRDLAADPALVYHLLRFYQENPAARSELGSDAALRRAKTTSFT